jgi:hypothetical protein
MQTRSYRTFRSANYQDRDIDKVSASLSADQHRRIGVQESEEDPRIEHNYSWMQAPPALRSKVPESGHASHLGPKTLGGFLTAGGTSSDSMLVAHTAARPGIALCESESTTLQEEGAELAGAGLKQRLQLMAEEE